MLHFSWFFAITAYVSGSQHFGARVLGGLLIVVAH